MINYRELAAEMLRQGAAMEVADARDLAAAVSDLLADPAKRHRMGQRAAEVAATEPQAIGLNLRLAERYL
jgi:3-deoxy-D-manno-octulosonic-acid transferase